MYEGDKARDASSKIRGFLFQDYITIMCLLKNEAEYVCTEYLDCLLYTSDAADE